MLIIRGRPRPPARRQDYIDPLKVARVLRREDEYSASVEKPYGEMNFAMSGKSEGYNCTREAHSASLSYTP